MTRCISIILTLCLILAAIPEAHASNVEQSLVVGIQSNKTARIRPLDPEERDFLSVYDLMYESLVVIDDNYMPQPGLAESWEVSPNGRTWTFKLRSGITFHDGSPLRADDVVATMQYILNRASDEVSANRGYYRNLKYFVSGVSCTPSTEQSPSLTVVVKAERPYFGLLYAMTFPVLPAAYVEQDNPPGTGAYRIRSFEPGQSITLQRYTGWWKTAPQVESIYFMCNQNPRDVIEDYEYARVETIFTRSIAAAQYRSGTGSLAISSRTNQLEVLLMNHSSSRLADIRVRKAIRMVVDPDSIAGSVYMGMVTRTDFPFIPGTWTYNDALESTFTQNLSEARKLLEEAGWGDSNQDGYLDRLNEEDPTQLVEFNLNLYVYEEPDNDVRIEAANMIQEQLAQVGIIVNITTMTFTGIQEKLDAGSFNLALVSFAMDPCPDPGFMLMTGNTGNYGRYRSNQMTDLFKQLRTCTEQNEYRQKLMEIQQTFAEDCPFICLYYRNGVILTRRMYTVLRDIREGQLLRGIEAFHP